MIELLMSVLHLIAISGHAVFGHAVYCHAISGHATIGRAFFVMPSLIKIFVNCNFQWFSIHNKLLCLHIRQIVMLKHSSHVVLYSQRCAAGVAVTPSRNNFLPT